MTQATSAEIPSRETNHLACLRKCRLTRCGHIYYAEKQIIKALPKMAKKTSSPELKKHSSITSTRPKARPSGLS
jgi:hypothetical protein